MAMARKDEHDLYHDSDFITACTSFLDQHHLDSIQSILLSHDDTLNHSILIEFAELLDDIPWVAESLYFKPTKFLPLFEEAARLVQGDVKKRYELKKDLSDPEILVKDNVHIRLNIHGSAAECPETHPSIGRIRVKDIGHLITVKGTVIRSGAIKMLEGERLYECTKCKHRFKVYPEVESGNSVQQPTSCPSERTKPCSGTNFRPVEDTVVCHDYQEIRIQESMQMLGVGSVPRSITVVLKDDLADSIKAGDDVVVTGVLFTKWRSLIKDVRCDLEFMLHANYIRKANELRIFEGVSEQVVMEFQQYWEHFEKNPLKGRNTILQAICPQVYGLFTVKLAVALTLIGGVQHVDASGTRVRGESHLLLVGDPGTGKSQFLKFAAKLSHRSVITTGLGSTSAGLTVAAIKDGGEWMLEAGALVLADGGLCCIDEFDSIREPDRATIHEAMEQQTISVAKAGLVTTLNTRATVFGVTNPKGNYDPYQPLSVNTTLSGPLLSRFDIILVLLDTKNPEWDKIVSSHILKEHLEQGNAGVEKDLSSGFWTLDMLKRYIQYVKGHFRPVLTADAEIVIVSYYQLQRRSALQNAAHARLMFRNEVTRADAVAAIVCVESSMMTSAILENVGNALHSSFSDNPDEEYVKQEKLILERLNITSSSQGGGVDLQDRSVAGTQGGTFADNLGSSASSGEGENHQHRRRRLSATTEEGLLFGSQFRQAEDPVPTSRRSK